MEVIMKKILILGFFLVNSFFCIASSPTEFYPVEVKASSYLMSNNGLYISNYHPYYLLDNDTSTAWVEGAQGDGINEYINFSLKIPAGTKFSLSIRNGYQKTDDLYYKNNRVKELEVKFKYFEDRYQKYDSYSVLLEDKLDWQTFDFEVDKNYDSVELKIKSVYSGTKYQDTCISDVIFNINGKIDNKLYEAYKSKYVNWFQEMNKRSSFFKNLPLNYPFKNYKKSSYSAELPIDNYKVDMDLFDKIFPNTDWISYSASEYGKSVKSLLQNISQKNEKECMISFKVPKIYSPLILSDKIFDIGNFTRLQDIDIKPITTQRALPSSKYYWTISLGGRIVKITEVLIDEKNQTTVNYYYYDNQGKLIYIDGDKDRDDGEFYKSAFLAWENDKISKIFLVNGIEIVNGMKTDKLSFTMQVFK